MGSEVHSSKLMDRKNMRSVNGKIFFFPRMIQKEGPFL
jgi:hypothetical protein